MTWLDTEALRPHAHTRGHLAAGAALRCGCGSDALDTPAATHACPAARWEPVRRQLTGWVRARLIYSSR
ncbi:hypothetical protein ET495_07480 [Xylanimonas allomyrinae]|uniref:Uncharacterized protein n=1 Tax=Xylanimonas allomyrinae TaxID=2509459 RepID=A0A4V0YE63_9MICO|nr:hypothetical protein [Xylanimonas allomyrinae]QAY63111.1 hypothetical protein ET495_07480 [Xylanimonas allomyrinae]